MTKASAATRRCHQCWKHKPLSMFRGKTKDLVRSCLLCRNRYGKGRAHYMAHREIRPGLRMRPADVRVRFMHTSHNRKLGPIAASITSAETCPRSCSFYGKGCFAEYNLLRHHWATTPDQGLEWAEFCRQVSQLSAGSLWRHNVAGDLPGHNDAIDTMLLVMLVFANRGRRGFTFSHKPLRTVEDQNLIAWANHMGFTVNLSADSLAQADELAALGVAPVAVVVPSTTASAPRTPAGRKVVLCPAETHGLTCERCRLCAKPDRKAIVAFKAHGQMKAVVSELVQLRRSA